MEGVGRGRGGGRALVGGGEAGGVGGGGGGGRRLGGWGRVGEGGGDKISIIPRGKSAGR